MSIIATNLFTKIDRCCGTTTASYTLAQKAIDINSALDDLLSIALKSAGFNVDDFNHTKDPFVTTDLVSGQRNYYFSSDESSNLILAINKVMTKDSASGIFRELAPVNQQRDSEMDAFWDGQSVAGVPTHYDRTGNGVFLDPIPNYNSTGGLKIFIDREPSYFTSSDTTKVAGVDGLCHDYLYLKPAYEYARDKGLENTNQLFRDLQISIQKIKDRYGNKAKDIKGRVVPIYQNNR